MAAKVEDSVFVPGLFLELVDEAAVVGTEEVHGFTCGGEQSYVVVDRTEGALVGDDVFVMGELFGAYAWVAIAGGNGLGLDQSDFRKGLVPGDDVTFMKTIDDYNLHLNRISWFGNRTS